MKSILPKVFQVPTSEVLEEIRCAGDASVSGVFSETTVHEMSPVRRLMLIGNYLILYEVIPKVIQDHTVFKPRRIAKLTFQTKFQMIKTQTSQIIQMEGGFTTNKYCGVKFQRDGHEALSLYCGHQQTLTAWRSALEKKINQKCFHQLFKPIKKLGKGSFASVYLAQRLEDKRMVAVKAFSKEACFNQQKGKQSLINQITLMRKMNHPNVMKLHGVYESQNSIYMTLELLDGTQLYNKIQSKHRFTLEETKTVMKSIMQGLGHMHQHKIMHRDLKPQNLMFRSKDNLEVVIVDFGLATWADQPEYLFVRCGTPGYVAPEIINLKNLKAQCDPVCDVFSAGLIFHILLMGKSIFPGRNYNDVLAQNKACNLDIDSKQYYDLDQAAHHLLKRMLDKNPESRIRASQVLRHSFFTQMQIQEPCHKNVLMQHTSQMLANTPLMRHAHKMVKPQMIHKPSFDYDSSNRNSPIGKENFPQLNSPRGYAKSIFKNNQ